MVRVTATVQGRYDTGTVRARSCIAYDGEDSLVAVLRWKWETLAPSTVSKRYQISEQTQQLKNTSPHEVNTRVKKRTPVPLKNWLWMGPKPHDPSNSRLNEAVMPPIEKSVAIVTIPRLLLKKKLPKPEIWWGRWWHKKEGQFLPIANGAIINA